MGRRRRTPGVRPAPSPVLAGHQILGPAGFGANGAVWSARDAAGRDVVVSLLALPRGEPGTALLRRLAALRHGTHPHLARIRQVVSLDDGRCAVVSDRVPGPTLATVLAARGRLEPAEAAGLLAGVGSALGHLHERGVVHGDVSPSNVIVGEDGDAVLVDLTGNGVHELGTPGFAAPERGRGDAAGAPGDVWSLARLVAWAAGEPQGVLRVLRPALDAVPARRPAARDVASRAPEIAPAGPVVVPAAPVLAQARMRDDAAPTRRRPVTRRQVAAVARVDAPAPGKPAASSRAPAAAGVLAVVAPTAATGTAVPRASAPSSRSRSPATHGAGAAERSIARRRRRRQPLPAAWLGVALSIAVAAVVAGAIVWTASGERAGGLTAGPDPPDGTVLAELLARRDGALVARDGAALAATTVPGGPAAREDVVLLERLHGTDTRVEHLRTEVSAVERVAAAEQGTAVDAVLVQQAHDRLTAGERVTVPARQPRCARLVLVPDAAGTWRILRSAPCP